MTHRFHILLLTLLFISLQPKPASAQENLPQPVLVWEQINTAPMPSPRFGFSMTLNTTNQVALLFGGHDYEVNDLNDLWLSDGRQWLPFETPHRPPGRAFSSLAYDSGHNEAVLFGGMQYTGNLTYLHDTWTFNGIDWTEQHPQAAPPPCAQTSLVYDPDRQLTYLFGGAFFVEKDLSLYNDTWAWDGVEWQQLFPQNKPARRSDAAMAYDPVHHYTLLYGGGSYAAPLNDTWIWDGENWIEQHPVHHPSAFFHGAQVVFDTSRQQIMLVGRNSPLYGDRMSETWYWDGTDWIQMPIARPLPYYAGGKLIYLPELQTVAQVDTFIERVENPDGSFGLINRSEVWALAERYLSYFPLVAQ